MYDRHQQDAEEALAANQPVFHAQKPGLLVGFFCTYRTRFDLFPPSLSLFSSIFFVICNFKT